MRKLLQQTNELDDVSGPGVGSDDDDDDDNDDDR